MTSEQWNEKWWELYRAYVKAGKDPMAAFKAAHDRMLRVFGPEPEVPKPKGAAKAGPPLWVKFLAPLAGVEMGFISKIWEWLNGKKTVIGAVITVIALIGDQLGIILPLLGVDAVLVAKVIGIVSMVLGVAHKVYKFLYKEEHP